MAADIVELAEGFKTVITASFANAPAIDATIDLEFAESFDVGTFTDLIVAIYPQPYRNAGDIDRLEFELEGMVMIAIAHRYQLPGPVPKEWIKERTEIVQDRVFMAIEGIEPESWYGFRRVDNRVPVLCDSQFLREHKVFWSEVHVTVRKIKP